MTDKTSHEANHQAWSDCKICSHLKEKETASQKFGWQENDTCLPPAVDELLVIYNENSHGSRLKQVRQCPLCKTSYLYTSDYEYLVNGSEEEQTLTRLAPTEAEKYLQSGIP